MALSKIEKEKIQKVFDDPVLWAKAHVLTYDQALKKVVPWTARWYQAEMLRDKSRKKVYRCGRRTGKTETMCVEALYQTNTNKEFVFVFVAPYENQIRLIFTRLMELVNGSPLIKSRLIGSTKNPYVISFLNNSRIVGFTTGASSNSGGASIRGQRANMIACDEMDYLGDGDFENISMLAAERPGIRIVTSSTPTGRRGEFWKICTNKNIGYVEHYHPSTHNPNWSDQMEAEFRAELTELGYIHEVLADFGPQDTGVFNKDAIDKARQFDNYAYNELTRAQLIRLERTGDEPPIMYEPVAGKFKRNIFRTMGVDWDKTA
jgi:replicative DNA helicase